MQQLAYVASEYPERTSLLAASLYADSVLRPSFAADVQQAFVTSQVPERNAPEFLGIFEDRIERPFLGVTQQLAYAGLSYLLPPTYEQPLYEATVYRPEFATMWQLAYAAPFWLTPLVPPAPPIVTVTLLNGPTIRGSARNTPPIYHRKKKTSNK